ncbi:MAG: DNA-directed RNA polymerase subunit beta, partial [Tepidisphaeraceae bacterium]
MKVSEIRDFSKRGDAIAVPNLIKVQQEAYTRFLQKEVDPTKRKVEGLESLLREVFPIVSYDGNLTLEYLNYTLSEARYTPDECRALRLTYGMPFRIGVKLSRKDKDEILEDSIYVGEIPIMIGGGEFIINGAERVIVNQLHRSPGVDFLVETQEGDRPLHGFRVIPERGSWIECAVTKKDALAVRIDQSSKIPATTFIRALDAKYSTNESIIKEFYTIENVKVGQLQPAYYAAATIIDSETGEELVKAGAQLGEAVNKIQASTLKSIAVVTKVADPLILNTLAEDSAESHEAALMKIYARLRPGNPPQLEKAKTLFNEKFYDENRYRLGRVGRFRINRKF